MGIFILKLGILATFIFLFIYWFSLISSFGIKSIKKSKISVLFMQLDISVFYRVRLFPSSVLSHDRYVSSIINISQALANRTGASALIILTSSSDFIIFFTLARGSWEFLKISGSKIFIRVKKFNP